MRQIVLDVDTTGLDIRHAHRIIEIACVELIDRQPSGHFFHVYINPQRDSDPESLKVHELSTAFLADKPLFADIVDAFLDFVRGTEVLAHNAGFDVGFLDAELARCTPSQGRLNEHVNAIVDTLSIAREAFPGKPASLNALCRRLGIELSRYQSQGALRDAQQLADVYLAMTAAKQCDSAQ